MKHDDVSLTHTRTCKMNNPINHIKAARKNYTCNWCAERIERGRAYVKWFTYGENVTTRMHSECFAAMQNANLLDNELPPAGTYRRGESEER